MKFKLIGCCFLAIFSTYAFANKYESLDVIKQKVHEFVNDKIKKSNPKANIKIKVSQIDLRLKLAKCDTSKLKIYQPYKRSIEQSSTIGVKCYGPTSWSFFVPIDVEILNNVLVTNKHLQRNHLLTLNDVKIVKLNTMKLRQGFYTNYKGVIGKLTKRTMYKNRVIKPNSLKLAKLIIKGDLIKITAANSTINVSVKGIALKGGKLGQHITVKNLTSNKINEGKVVGKKEVLINL